MADLPWGTSQSKKEKKKDGSGEKSIVGRRTLLLRRAYRVSGARRYLTVESQTVGLTWCTVRKNKQTHKQTNKNKERNKNRKKKKTPSVKRAFRHLTEA